MGGHTPNYFSNAFATPELQGLQYNTSVAGTVIQIVFGTNRIGSNLLQYQNFQSSSPGKLGGKGGSGGKGSKGQNTYYKIDIAVGFCQGPIKYTGSALNSGGDNLIWSNGGVVFGGWGAIPMNPYAGADGQAPDPILNTDGYNIPAIGYSGLAYVAGRLTLQATPTLPDVDAEITGFEAGTAGGSYPNDANPANIIIRLLTDPRFGAGFPLTNVDVVNWVPNTDIAPGLGTFNTYASYCEAEQLAMSLTLDRQQPASQWLEEIAQVTNAALCWSGTTLKIIPYSAVTVTGQGLTYLPNITPVYTLSDDDILMPAGGSDLAEDIGINPDDPIQITRTDPAQVANWLSLEYRNAVNAYNIDVVAVWDQGLIDQTQLRTQPASTEHGFTNVTSATASANLQLLDKTTIRADPIKFKLGFRHTLLDLMDVIAINDDVLGYVNKLCWVTAIEENENGELDITCREVSQTVGTPLLVNRQNTAGAPPSMFAMPPDVNIPFITEPTSQLAVAYGISSPTLVIGLSGGPNGMFSPVWGGAQIMLSTDNETYGYLGALTGASIMGLTTSDLMGYSGGNPTGQTVTVDLTESAGTLSSVSTGSAANGQSLFAISDLSGNVEFISYTTATLVEGNVYTLSGLYRGLYGTVASDKPIGSQFFYLASKQFFSTTLASQFTGKTLWFKFLSYNTYGLEIQDIADVVAYQYVPTGASPFPNVFPTGIIRTAPINIEHTGTFSLSNISTIRMEIIHNIKRGFNLPLDTIG
jgi:hypothetical protein